LLTASCFVLFCSCSPASPGSFQSFGSEASAFHQQQKQQQQQHQQQQQQQAALYGAEALSAQYHAPSSAAGGFPSGQGQSFFSNGDMGGPGAPAISAPPPGYSGGHQQQHLGETVSSPTGFQDNSGAYQQVKIPGQLLAWHVTQWPLIAIPRDEGAHVIAMMYPLGERCRVTILETTRAACCDIWWGVTACGHRVGRLCWTTPSSSLDWRLLCRKIGA
jgi:hypothetical protein